MPRVMAVGKRAEILPFRAVGVEVRGVASPEDARSALRELHESGEETLLLIPEDLAAECSGEIAQFRRGVATVVMTLPAASGERGAQRELVRQLVARSLGVDLMGRKK